MIDHFLKISMLFSSTTIFSGSFLVIGCKSTANLIPSLTAAVCYDKRQKPSHPCNIMLPTIAYANFIVSEGNVCTVWANVLQTFLVS